MKKVLALTIITCFFVSLAFGAPNNPPSHNKQDIPHPHPQIPPIYQSFSSTNSLLNLGELPIDGINISGKMGTMGPNSSITVRRRGIDATVAATRLNCSSNRFIALSELYEVTTTGMNQYFGLPAKYAIIAKAPVPPGSRLFMMVSLANKIYFIPASSTNLYGMFIGEINSCAIYEEIALIADTSYGNCINSYMIATDLDSNNKPLNPYYANFDKDDGFSVTSHIFLSNGRGNSGMNNINMSIIQPVTSLPMSLYKYGSNNEQIFVQKVSFKKAENYSFCTASLAGFEKYYDERSVSHAIWVSFNNTNIEDIPNALIFRSTCCDQEGVRYITEDQMIYINLQENGHNSPFSRGNGTYSKPYVITNVSQLDKIRDYNRRFFMLGNDIDMSSYTEKSWLPIGDRQEPFNGLLNGNGKSIRNLTIYEPSEKYQGLFGCVKNGSIKNLKVELSPNGIECSSFAGIIAGSCDNSRIYQCHTKGSIKGEGHIGGIVGQCLNSTIRKSISDCNLSALGSGAITGGLVGYGQNSVITDSFSKANVTATGEESYIGGLIGKSERLKLQNCYSIGSLNGIKKGYAGGLSAYAKDCEIKGCIAINERISSEKSGRLVGFNENNSFARCYAWKHIKDKNNKYLSQGGFGGSENSKDKRNGEDAERVRFFGSGTRNKFWSRNNRLGFSLDYWVFNSGYNLPQLRKMPSVNDPEYVK